jgi:Carboxypeptidase regulatory-like domain
VVAKEAGSAPCREGASLAGFPLVCRNNMRLMQTTRLLVLASAAMTAFIALCPADLTAKKKVVIPRTVTGVVLDKNDNPISGAVVEMTDTQTGKKLASYSGEDGHYTFSNLDVHRDYQLQARYQGQSSDVRTASSFDSSNKIILNLRIPPEP